MRMQHLMFFYAPMSVPNDCLQIWACPSQHMWTVGASVCLSISVRVCPRIHEACDEKQTDMHPA